MSDTLSHIESQTKTYAQERAHLEDLVSTLNEQLAAVKRRALPAIKKAVAAAAAERSKLNALIDANHHLFEKPRTAIFHGIKVGLRKGSGGVDWEDDDRVVALIEKHLSKSEAELLIKVTKKPIASAIQDLDVADLKKIGCTIEATGDVVVIKAVDGEVDKLVNALLKDATDEAVSEKEAA